MATLTRRLQLLLEEDLYERVAKAAARRHTSVAAVIRDAVERDLDDAAARRRAAGAALLAADPMSVPDDPADLKLEIEEMFDGRAQRWE